MVNLKFISKNSFDGGMIRVSLSSVLLRFGVLSKGNSVNVHAMQVYWEIVFTVLYFYFILEIFKGETGVTSWYTLHFTHFLFAPTALLHTLHFAALHLRRESDHGFSSPSSDKIKFYEAAEFT